MSDAAACLLAWTLVVPLFVLSGSRVESVAWGMAATAATVLAMLAAGTYRSWDHEGRGDEILRTLFAASIGGTAYSFLQWPMDAIWQGALVGTGLSIVLMTMLRGHHRRWLRDRRAGGQYLRRVVLVGSNHDAEQLWRMLCSEPELGYEVAAVLGRDSGSSAWGGLPMNDDIAGLTALAARTRATEVLIVPNSLNGSDTDAVIEASAESGLRVQIWPGLSGLGARRLRKVPLAGEAFLYIEPQRTHKWQHAAKRGMDIVGASVLLVVAAPVMLVTAVAVVVFDGRPVLHRQCRVGLNGKPFTLHKFRTMRTGSGLASAERAALNERTDGPLFKCTDDPRVTGAGRVLRASSIDELPQLWNVLLGSMSLVGPRPALPVEVEDFDEHLRARRHSMRPGLTGLWQIHARDNPSFHAYRRLDLHYVRNWTVRMDLGVIMATIPMLLVRPIRSLLHGRSERVP